MTMTVSLRCYEELNDFLPVNRRKKEFGTEISATFCVADLLASIGIACSRVDLILVNGKSVSFSHPLQDGDRISVYPVFESFDISTVSKLRRHPLRRPRFILDTHLGKLAKYMRMIGFNCLYRNDFHDTELVRRSLAEERIILTRDRELLKRREVVRGYALKHTQPAEQLTEIVSRFDLKGLIRPFSRCMACNGRINPQDPESVHGKVPPAVLAGFTSFTACSGCGKIYWQGSHHASMMHFLDVLFQGSVPLTYQRQATGHPDRLPGG